MCIRDSYLRVRNHGTTIAPEHLARLFERFYRVDQSRERSAQSNGLGLSIVATIMQLHQGRYSVSSVDGITCFELFFPARQSPSSTFPPSSLASQLPQ